MIILKLFQRIKPKTVWELKEEHFVLASIPFKTLRVTASGGMSIDPKEIRDKVIQQRQNLKTY